MFKDPFFWAALISLFINYELFQLNRKQLNILTQKPVIDIKTISISACKDGGGGFYLDIEVFNPSSLGNFFKISILDKRVPLKIIYRDSLAIPKDSSDYQSIAPFERKRVSMQLDGECSKKNSGKMLMLRLIDIRGQTTRKKFLFEQNYL